MWKLFFGSAEMCLRSFDIYIYIFIMCLCIQKMNIKRRNKSVNGQIDEDNITETE